MSTRFEWDPAKERANRRKHGLDFRFATRAFADPLAVVVQDRIEGGELRWRTTGMVGGGIVVVVAHSIEDDDPRGEVIRIISARSATRSERRRYEEERRRYL
ncbi:MAG: BrnT family toxin [Geminicoccaceae bacterium]